MREIALGTASAGGPFKGDSDRLRILTWVVVALFAAGLGYIVYGALRPPAFSYHGGDTLDSPTVYALFWLPRGQHFEQGKSSDRRYMHYVSEYLRLIGGTRYLKTITQYTVPYNTYVGDSVKFGGSVLDQSPFPWPPTRSHPLKNKNLVEMADANATSRWMQIAGDETSIVFLFLPKGALACSHGAGCNFGTQPHGHVWCGFHSVSSQLEPVVVVSTAGRCRSRLQSDSVDPAAATGVVTTNHELLETITDPFNNGWNAGPAGEIMDLCPGRRNRTSVPLHGHRFILGKIWSAKRKRCVSGP